MEFKDLKLHPDLQRGIDEAGYVSCMPVQEKVLSVAFGGQDLYVQSQTGTGKTAAFLVVIFQRLLSEENLSGKKALIMAPTRELAVQIEEEAQILGRYLPFKTGSFYGGVGYTQQRQLLRNNVQILAGTPGRILDLNKSGEMNLMNIAFLVLDEADRMFDMGFYPDLCKLIKVVPPADRRQTMLFSATLNAWVKNLAWEYTKNPAEIEIEPEIVTVDEVSQTLYHVPSHEKMRLLLGLLRRELSPEGGEAAKSAIVFCNTKRYTEIVAKRLQMNGYKCEFITGDMPQVKRLKVIEDLKAGKVKLLAATDVAARGLDIDSLSMVINYDLPDAAENYVHRIGRTARAGKTGKAFTLASEHDVYELPAIERYIGKKIDSEVASGDLYAQDKSEGAAIRSEFYEERPPQHGAKSRGRGQKPPRRREAERSPPPKREAPAEASRQATKEGRARREKPQGRPAAGPRPDARLGRQPGRQPGKRPGRQPGQAPMEKDLSALSLEERLSFYKAKYSEDRPAQAESGSKPAGKGRKGPKQRGGKKRGDPQNQHSPQQAGRQAPAAAKAAPPAAGDPAAQSADKAAHKGFLSKLLGIFKKP